MIATSCALALWLATPSSAREPALLVIRDVSVVDVEAGRLVPLQTVVIRGRRIERVSPADAEQFPAGARQVDGRGRYLIPGLWDAHIHADEASLTRLVAYGITGAREMGGDLAQRVAWRQRIASGTLIGPRVVISGPKLVGGAAGRTANQWPIAIADEGVRAVDTLAALGADFVKVHEGLSRDAFLAIARQARARGLPLAGHVPDDVHPTEAAEAGMASIEHLEFIPSRCLPLFHPGADTARAASLPECGPAAMNSLLIGLVRAGTRLDPTIGSFRAWVSADFHRWILAGFRSLVPALRRSGVTLLAGTDSEGMRIPTGSSLHDELALLVDAGFAPAEALRAATVNPARFFGVGDSVGTVQSGRVADLVLLDGNPLADIHQTARIHAVVIAGRLLERAELERMKGQVER